MRKYSIDELAQFYPARVCKYFILLSEFYLPLKLHSYSLILIISVFCVRLFAEDYRIYLLGIPIVNVSMESSNNALSFHTETLGMIHSIYIMLLSKKVEVISVQ